MTSLPGRGDHKVAAITRFKVEQFADMVNKLRSLREGEGDGVPSMAERGQAVINREIAGLSREGEDYRVAVEVSKSQKIPRDIFRTLKPQRYKVA